MKRINALKAKEACPKVVAPRAWPYEEVLEPLGRIRAKIRDRSGVQKDYLPGGCPIADTAPGVPTRRVQRQERAQCSSQAPYLQKGLAVSADLCEIHLIDPRLGRGSKPRL